MYNDGYVFTRRGKGVMHQTRSVRVDLSKFELSSENRRILRKNSELRIMNSELPYDSYSWEIGKLAKDFYDEKFGSGTMTANKVKEILTNKEKSNFNLLLRYSINNEQLTNSNFVGYTVCYANTEIFHYSYPFYNLDSEIKNLGMGMMTLAIATAKENGLKYVYLGSFQRPTDTYKLQFRGIEWFDGEKWNDDLEELKKTV